MQLWVSGCDTVSFTRESYSDTLRARLAGGASELPLVLHVGRLAAEKQTDHLPLIFSEVSRMMHGQVRFAVVGDGHVKEEMEGKCKELGASFACSSRSRRRRRAARAARAARPPPHRPSLVPSHARPPPRAPCAAAHTLAPSCPPPRARTSRALRRPVRLHRFPARLGSLLFVRIGRRLRLRLRDRGVSSVLPRGDVRGLLRRRPERGRRSVDVRRRRSWISLRSREQQRRRGGDCEGD